MKPFESQWTDLFGLDHVFNFSYHTQRRQNLLAFKKAREIAGDEVASVIECTGSSQVLNAALEARTIRGDGSYVLLSCLYCVGFDMALVRRDEGTVFTVRRSRYQFRSVLDDLAKDPAYYERLIGHVVDFNDLPQLYEGNKGDRVGKGPKVMITY